MNKDLHSMSIASDEELMLLYQGGDDAAFGILYQRHERKVYSYLHKRLRSSEEVAEVFQNTFFKLHRQRNKYKKDFLFLQWLFVIARSELIDFARGKKALQTKHQVYAQNLSPDSRLDPLQTLIDQEISQLKEFQLDEREKIALQQRIFSQEDFESIAKALGTGQANTRQIIDRALKKLKLGLIK